MTTVWSVCVRSTRVDLRSGPFVPFACPSPHLGDTDSEWHRMAQIYLEISTGFRGSRFSGPLHWSLQFCITFCYCSWRIGSHTNTNVRVCLISFLPYHILTDYVSSKSWQRKKHYDHYEQNTSEHPQCPQPNVQRNWAYGGNGLRPDEIGLSRCQRRTVMLKPFKTQKPTWELSVSRADAMLKLNWLITSECSVSIRHGLPMSAVINLACSSTPPSKTCAISPIRPWTMQRDAFEIS